MNLQLYSETGNLVLTEAPYLKSITRYSKPRKDIKTKNNDTINYINKTKNVTVNYMGNAVDYNNLPSALETKILLSSIKKNNTTNTTTPTTTNNLSLIHISEPTRPY